MAYIVTILLCIAADQTVKLWTVAHLALFETRPLLPGLVELCYVQNTGGGFSILAQYTWLLTAVTVVLMAVIAGAMVKKVFPHPAAMWSLTAILGGGLGNLIDRVRLGYVVDMFHFEFFPSFPVFNVADICVVCGTIGFAAYYLLLHEKVTGRKEAERGGDGHPDGTP